MFLEERNRSVPGPFCLRAEIACRKLSSLSVIMQALTTLSFSGASGVSAVAKLLVFFQVGAFQSNLSFLGSLIMLSYADVHADNTEKRLSTNKVLVVQPRDRVRIVSSADF